MPQLGIIEIDSHTIEMTLEIVAELVAVVPFVGQGMQALVKAAQSISRNLTKINEVLVAEKHLSVKACQTIALVVKLQLQQRLNANPQNAAIAQLAEDCDELRSVAERIANHISGQVRRDSTHISRSALRKCGLIRVPYTVRDLTEKLKDAEQNFILKCHIQTRLCLTDMNSILHEIRQVLYEVRDGATRNSPSRLRSEELPPYTANPTDMVLGYGEPCERPYSSVDSSPRHSDEHIPANTERTAFDTRHNSPHRMRSVPNLIAQRIPDQLLHTNAIPTAETGYTAAPRRVCPCPDPLKRRQEYVYAHEIRSQRSMMSLNPRVCVCA